MEIASAGANRRTHMLNDPMHKLIPEVALPSVISMLVGAIYNMADTFFVGQLGNSATGAVGIVMPIMNLLMALAFIFAHGATSYVSRLLGNNETEHAEKTIATAFAGAMALGLVFGAISLLFMDAVLLLFGSTATILPYAREYALYIFLASPVFAGSYVLNNTLRAEGSATKAMVGMGAGAVLNIVLDPIFIFGFGWGVSGAGAATMIGQFVSFFLLVWFYKTKGPKKSMLNLSARLFSPHWPMFREILRVGIPSFFRMGLNSAAMIFLNNAAGPYGDGAIAAFSVVGRILMLVNSALIGYGQGYQPISGFNYGAQNYRRVLDAFWFTLKTSVLFMTLFGTILFFFGTHIIALFRDDPAVIELGTRTLQVQAAALPLMAASLVSSMLFQSIGRAAFSFVIACARQGLCFIPLLLLLAHFFRMDGIVYAQAAADLAALLITIPLTYIVLKELIKKEDKETT